MFDPPVCFCLLGDLGMHVTCLARGVGYSAVPEIIYLSTYTTTTAADRSVGSLLSPLLFKRSRLSVSLSHSKDPTPASIAITEIETTE